MRQDWKSRLRAWWFRLWCPHSTDYYVYVPEQFGDESYHMCRRCGQTWSTDI